MVAADGLNSAVRARYADTFGPTLDERDCKYMWLGTDKVFDAFKFYIAQTPYGVMQIHGYPYDATRQHVHRRDDLGGLGASRVRRASPTGRGRRGSPTRSRSSGSGSCSPTSSTGTRCMANNSRWISFTTVRNERWVHAPRNVVLLGDAAHTAHFSIGSGTKLAMEDALALAACLHEEPTLAAALTTYETERKAVVLSTQRAAQASLEWFENLGQYVHQEPLQFAFNIMTRSRRVTYDNLRLRDPEFVARCDEWFAAPASGAAGRPPADVPAVPARRPRAGQPGRRLADGHVRRGRRPARATSTSCTSAARRSAGPGW